MLADEKLTQDELEQEDNILAECLVTDNSELIGLSLQEANFRRSFGSFVLAISKRRRNHSKKTCPFYFKAF